jgi:hypothetical protein
MCIDFDVSFPYLMCIHNIYNVPFNMIIGHPECADHPKCAHINNDLEPEMWCPFSMCRPNFYTQQGISWTEALHLVFIDYSTEMAHRDQLPPSPLAPISFPNSQNALWLDRRCHLNLV